MAPWLPTSTTHPVSPSTVFVAADPTLIVISILGAGHSVCLDKRIMSCVYHGSASRTALLPRASPGPPTHSSASVYH